MEINGIPLHPLVVHAAVVFVPLAGTAALAYACVPRWRWWLRWPLAGLTFIAMASAYLATVTGSSLLDSRPELGQLGTVSDHAKAGRLLRTVMIGFTVVSGLGIWRLGGPSALASGRGAREQRGGVDLALAGLLVLASLVVLAAVVQAGHTGAKAVWG